MSGLLLVDKSAYVRGPRSEEFAETLCLCPIVELEILYSARSPAQYTEIEEGLARFRSLRVDAQTFAAARAAQQQLAARGRHRIPMPCLLIAACAQQHGAGVLHVDRHYEVLADVLEFEAVQLAV